MKDIEQELNELIQKAIEQAQKLKQEWIGLGSEPNKVDEVINQINVLNNLYSVYLIATANVVSYEKPIDLLLDIKLKELEKAMFNEISSIRYF